MKNKLKFIDLKNSKGYIISEQPFRRRFLWIDINYKLQPNKISFFI